MGAQKDYTHGRSETPDPVEKIKTIGIRIVFEFVVAYKNIDWHFDQQLEKPTNTLAFEADLDVWTTLKKMLDAEENEWMIVGNTHSDFVHSHSIPRW
jgi:hypothetical protein